MPDEPSLCVVVATHNRARLLPRLVAALEGQDADDFEVVIVDDGSTDDTMIVLEELASRSRMPIRTIRLERNAGPSAARNAGWRAASGSLIAFTDDDCVPQPSWLAALRRGLAEADIAQGRTVAHPEQQRIAAFYWTPEIVDESGYYETCNIGYRRATLEAATGFDEAFHRPGRHGRPPLWGEDTDLALRVKKMGGSTTFVEDALVWHDINEGPVRDRLDQIPRRRGLALLAQRHPEVRQTWGTPRFHELEHRQVLGVVAGLTLVFLRPDDTRAWAAAAALSLPWIRSRGRPYPLRVWHRMLPRWLIVDTAEVAYLAAVSAQHKTLVL